MYETFDNLFDYIKRRIKAIKEIFDNSDQFNTLLESLQSKIKQNEKSLTELYSKYNDTLKIFTEFEAVLKEINSLDNDFKNLLIK